MKPLLLLVLAAMAVAGCNTVRGAGQDMSAAGNAVAQSADEVQRKM